MTVLLTCGPAWEPLDGMRRLTNASTGALGARLAEALASAGHRVVVFRGEGATAPPPRGGMECVGFGTNEDLASRLEAFPNRDGVGAVLHAAALCDYRVARVANAEGHTLHAAKFPSRAGRLRVDLEPAAKVLPRLRAWFPRAWLVGWKLELEGGREAVLAAAWRQLAEAGADACVVNGTAWGAGFGLCEPPDRVQSCSDAQSLSQALLTRLGPVAGAS